MLTHLFLTQIADKGKSEFRASEDTVTRYAAEHAVELFAEVAKKVRGAFEKANPKVPWP